MVNDNKFFITKTVHEFNIKSFEKHQAYKIMLPQHGLCKSTFTGLLVDVTTSSLTFLVTDEEACDTIYTIHHTDTYSLIKVGIEDYFNNTILITKLDD